MKYLNLKYFNLKNKITELFSCRLCMMDQLRSDRFNEIYVVQSCIFEIGTPWKGIVEVSYDTPNV